MHNTMRRTMAVVVVLAMLVAVVGVVPVQAEEAGYNAKLTMIAENWWPDATSAAPVTITGDGTYSITWNPESWEAVSNLWVFAIDIEGAKDQVVSVSDVTVTADGVSVPVDMSKVAAGDLENNGNYRIELYNLYGPTAENPAIATAVSITTELVVTFTVDMVGSEGEETTPEETVPEETVPEETVPEETVPEETVPEETVPEESTPEESGYTASLMMIAENWWPDASSAAPVNVTGDGTYTFTWNPQSWEAVSNLWVLCIDIAGAEGQVASVSNVTVTADGVSVPVDMSKVATGDLEDNGNYRIELYNLYGPTAEDPAVSSAVSITTELSVSFTVDMNPAEETVPEETVPEETVPEETVPEETVPEETVPEETVPEETVPEETVPEESIPEETVPEETVPEESVPEESVPEGGTQAYNSTASLYFADADWWPSMTSGRVTTNVTGAGTYTITWVPTEEESYGSEISGAMVFCIDLMGAQEALNKDGYTYKLESIAVYADGKSVPVDVSKVATGDLEGKGNYRIELYNEYGNTKDALDLSQLVFTEKLSVTFRLIIVDAQTGEVVDDSNPQTGDLFLPVAVGVTLISALALVVLVDQRKKWSV